MTHINLPRKYWNCLRLSDTHYGWFLPSGFFVSYKRFKNAKNPNKYLKNVCRAYLRSKRNSP